MNDSFVAKLRVARRAKHSDKQIQKGLERNSESHFNSMNFHYRVRNLRQFPGSRLTRIGDSRSEPIGTTDFEPRSFYALVLFVPIFEVFRGFL